MRNISQMSWKTFLTINVTSMTDYNNDPGGSDDLDELDDMDIGWQDEMGGLYDLSDLDDLDD